MRLIKALKYTVVSQSLISIFPFLFIPWSLYYVGAKNYGNVFEWLTLVSLFSSISTFGSNVLGPTLISNWHQGEPPKALSRILNIQFFLAIILAPLLVISLSQLTVFSLIPNRIFLYALTIIFFLLESLNPTWFIFYTGNQQFYFKAVLISRAVPMVLIAMSLLLRLSSSLFFYISVSASSSILLSGLLLIFLCLKEELFSTTFPSFSLRRAANDLMHFKRFAISGIIPSLSINASWKIVQSYLPSEVVALIAIAFKLVQQLRAVYRNLVGTMSGHVSKKDLSSYHLNKFIVNAASKGLLLFVMLTLVTFFAAKSFTMDWVSMFGLQKINHDSSELISSTLIIILTASMFNFQSSLIGMCFMTLDFRMSRRYASFTIFTSAVAPLLVLLFSYSFPKYALQIGSLTSELLLFLLVVSQYAGNQSVRSVT